MNAERRSQPRTASPACPHCEQPRIGAHHYRDAGDLGPDEALRLGYCPVLAARRTATPYLRTAPAEQARPFLWSADDARIAARVDMAAR